MYATATEDMDALTFRTPKLGKGKIEEGHERRAVLVELRVAWKDNILTKKNHACFF